MYRRLRLIALTFLYEIPVTKPWAYRRLPKHRAGYKEYWVNKGGNYRATTLKEDIRKASHVQYPTKRDMVAIIGKYAPKSVLDVGCGYGRHLHWLKPYFTDVQGC